MKLSEKQIDLMAQELIIESRHFEIFDKSDAEKAKELSEEVIKFCDEKIKEII